MHNVNPAKPFLRWAGSKKKLTNVLSQYWNAEYERYVEPFAGSAALYFALNPKNAFLADINSDLISTYKAIRDECDSVINFLSPLTPVCKDTYLKLRALDTEALSSAQSAARFIYLNRHCFNGLYRTNLNGNFNVPFSASRTGKIPSNEDLTNCSKNLRKARIENLTFSDTLKQAEPGDFIYLDPPYVDSENRIFNEYDADSFNQSSLQLLRSHLEDLEEKNIAFVLSFTASKEGEFLAKGFTRKPILVDRIIAGKGGHRRAANELIITNIKR